MNLTSTKLAPLCFLLGAAYPAAGWAENQNFVLTADQVDYSRDGNTITAQGHVEVVSPQGAVQADSLTYDTVTDKLTAHGHVLMIDATNTSLFADSLDLSGDMKNGTLETLRLRSGAQTNVALTARRAIKRANIYNLEQARYSACPLTAGQDDNDLPWRINAQSIHYNADAEDITYRGASLSAFGLPVFYMPWFKHTTNTHKGESGLTPPRFGRSSRTGEEITLGYYYRPDDNEDYLLRLRAMSQKGVLGTLQGRYVGTHLASEFTANLANDTDLDKTRSAINGSGEITLRPGLRYGLNLQTASDDTFLDEYFGQTQPYLPTTAYIENTSAKHYTGLYASFYDDLRENVDDGTTAQVLPRLVFERIVDETALHGELVFSGDAAIIQRQTGSKYRRFIGGTEWRKPLHFVDGSLVDVKAKVRGDLYHVDDSTSGEDGFQNRGYSALSMNWTKPYISPSGHQTIAPQAMLVLSPDSSNNRDIPNEDSSTLELNSTNLFETNRFSGLDQVEAGSRVVYGLNSTFNYGEDVFYQLFFGQSYRLTENNGLPSGSGLADKNSDWVGAWRAQPNRYTSISQRFRLSNNTLATQQTDTEFSFTDGKPEGNYASGTYTYLKEGPEEFNLKSHYNFSDRYFMETDMRRDLANSNRWLNFEVALGYRHCCYNVTLRGRRRGFINREVDASTDFLLNFELLTLGRDHD